MSSKSRSSSRKNGSPQWALLAAHPLDEQQRLACAAALDMQLASRDGHTGHERER